MYLEHCPMPADGGGDCWAEPHPASRHGLCLDHWREVVKDWAADAPEMAASCPNCHTPNRFDPVDWVTARCMRCGSPMNAPWALTDYHREDVPADLTAPRAPGVIYYLRFRDTVKIGFTTNFKTRMVALPHDEVLATEPGDMKLERQRHTQFAEHRIKGQREWFVAAADILAHTEAIRAEHGDPAQLAAKIEASWVRVEVSRDLDADGVVREESRRVLTR